jgi:hypothetical protein
VKLSEIEVGGRYVAKVSQRLVAVRVVEIKQTPYSQRILAVNEATGRQITVRSPQRLRKRIGDGCEFCRQPFNRPDGGFTCPYCGKDWPRREA